MVGPDRLLSSAAAAAPASDGGGDVGGLERPPWNHDAHEDACEQGGRATDVTVTQEVDVDTVQLLTRRLSVSPPTDVHRCPAGLERRQMTTGTSTEVDIHSEMEMGHLL